MKHLENLEDFDKIVGEKKVLVDFYADWCGPCKMLSPILEEISKENKDITILKVNVDDFGELAEKYGIMSIPNLKLFDNGQISKEQVGLSTKEELEKLIK